MFPPLQFPPDKTLTFQPVIELMKKNSVLSESLVLVELSCCGNQVIDKYCKPAEK